MGAAVWRDGRVLWTGSAGFRDLDLELPVDENTVFSLASVSKLFAAAAAARLVESGDLEIDAPVQSIVAYLPAAPMAGDYIIATGSAQPVFHITKTPIGIAVAAGSQVCVTQSKYFRAAPCCSPLRNDTATPRLVTRC
jgi:hypothetical protein